MTGTVPHAATATAGWPDEPTRAFVGRTWGGCAALGTALLLVGLGSEHLRAGHAAVAALLLTLAVGAAVAAVAALRGGGRPLRRAAVVLSGAGAAGVLAGLLTQRFGVTELTAVALGTTGAVLLAWSGHGVTTDPPSAEGDGASPPRGVARLALLALGAVAVSAAVGNGLAATEAGEHAVPHGLHVGHR